MTRGAIGANLPGSQKKENSMNAILLRGGQAAGILGVLLIFVSAAARLAGNFTVGSLSTGTLMLAGIAGVSVGVFFLLWLLVERSVR
jgi:hypothetical protein